MNTPYLERLELHTKVESWPLLNPFRITGRTWEFVEVLFVTLKKGSHTGRGEAAGVYYRSDMPSSMRQQVEGLRTSIQQGMSRLSLQKLLPACPARNALDCALWDLEAKVIGHPAWELANLSEPRPLLTTFTCGADLPEKMANAALSYREARAIKMKLTGEPIDAERVRAVRAAKPYVWLGVDANQGFTRAHLERLLPELVNSRVELIEQPFPIGQEHLLDGFNSPIPIAADETVQSLSDMPAVRGRFNVINIKLDKSGGLTEALAMARAAQDLGVDTMVGNMLGTSLAMAPAFLVGQLCKVVDLDGPVFLKSDRPPTVEYTEGLISCPPALWGYPDATRPS
jgi:L-Ala-D/L-Glu epimerase